MANGISRGERPLHVRDSANGIYTLEKDVNVLEMSIEMLDWVFYTECRKRTVVSILLHWDGNMLNFLKHECNMTYFVYSKFLFCNTQFPCNRIFCNFPKFPLHLYSVVFFKFSIILGVSSSVHVLHILFVISCFNFVRRSFLCCNRFTIPCVELSSFRGRRILSVWCGFLMTAAMGSWHFWSIDGAV